jgi:RNA polymerase sigma-70 factor (ECF subfamily)
MGNLPSGRALWLAHHVLPHEPALRQWLRRRMRLDLEIDDVVQETYAKLATVESVAHILNPKAYLFQTARSILLQEVRRSRIVAIEAVSALDPQEIADDAPRADAQAEARDEWRQVSQVIDELPEKCRQVFLLRRLYGLSQREVAQRLGISENTVEKQVGRGIRHLAERFGRGGKHAIAASRQMNIDREQADDARDQRRN